MKTRLLIIIAIGIIGFSQIVYAEESPDPSLFRDLQKGETISNPEVTIIIQSLGAILIILFIILYAIKKRMVKKNDCETR